MNAPEPFPPHLVELDEPAPYWWTWCDCAGSYHDREHMHEGLHAVGGVRLYWSTEHDPRRCDFGCRCPIGQLTRRRARAAALASEGCYQ